MTADDLAHFIAVIASMVVCRALFCLGRRWLRKN